MADAMRLVFSRDEQDVFTLAHQRLRFPDNYFIFDIETTGFDPKVDLIWNVGWCVVVNRQITNCEDLTLDWTRVGELNQNWLRSRIMRQQNQMSQSGRQCKLTYERLQTGIEPWDVLDIYYQLLNQYVESDEQLVAHSGNFDQRLVDSHTVRFLDRDKIKWRPNSLFDTGLLEKAAQMNRPPHPGETLEEWYRRIRGGRSRVKWSLDGHCAEKYRLAERFGLDLDEAHGAGFDCRLTHALFETYRMIAEEVYG